MLKIALIYAYVVCFAAIVTAVINGAQIASYAVRYSNPEVAYQLYGYWAQPYEEYRMQHIERAGRAKTSPFPEEDIRRLFDERNKTQIEIGRFESSLELVSHGFVLAAAIVLFVIHFLWARKVVKAAESGRSVQST